MVSGVHTMALRPLTSTRSGQCPFMVGVMIRTLPGGPVLPLRLGRHAAWPGYE
jgi:hypothetical protein